ncbi:MAG: SufE family protein [Bacteroidetes bacterium]|nr:SufE family protein [Bacteroidota bacterium]
MTINQIQDEIIEEFEEFDDWMDKYSYIIEQSSILETLPEKARNDSNLIDGCQSRVWITAENSNGIVTYHADSDAILVKGLIALLMRVLNEQPAKDIATADLYFIDKIGMKENLSPTRANGFLSMIRQMKLYAIEIIENL